MAISPDLAFENLHQWRGELLPAFESVAFQAGKAAALRKLKPFAEPDSPHEAASVVLKSDGIEWSFEVGTRYQVSIEIPATPGVFAALLHCHPFVLAHSPADWHLFLTTPNIVQSHIVTAVFTYSLHKTSDWRPPKFLTLADVKREYDECTVRAFDQLEAKSIPMEPNEKRANGSYRVRKWLETTASCGVLVNRSHSVSPRTWP